MKLGPKYSSATDASRFAIVDVLRGVALILAMMDHVKVQFVPDFHFFVPLTRLSTPSFIIIFGAMIEIAYLSKIRSGRSLRFTQARMTERMLTCWALAVLLSFAAAASGNIDLGTAFRSIIGLEMGRFNEIFLIYSGLFIILIGILPIVARHGSVVIIALACLAWSLTFSLNSLVEMPSSFVNITIGLGFGYGPALLPSLTFLGFGMALGEMATGRRGPFLAFAMIALAVIICVFELSHGPLEAGRRFLAHRWINHPSYYAVGILGFVCIAMVIAGCIRWRVFKTIRGILAQVGAQSLFFYGFGNLLLNVLPIVELPRIAGPLAAITFMIGLIALACAGPQLRNTIGFGLPQLWRQFYGFIIGTLIRLVFGENVKKTTAMS